MCESKEQMTQYLDSLYCTQQDDMQVKEPDWSRGGGCIRRHLVQSLCQEHKLCMSVCTPLHAVYIIT